MARYIDADKIHEFVDIKAAEGNGGWANGVPYEWAYALTVIDMQPTADVAPRAEVERLERILNSYALQYGTVRDQQKIIDEAKREGAREIFEEIEQYTKDVGFSSFAERFEFADFIAELKKKYAEDNNR